MQDIKCFTNIVLVDDERYIALCCALRNRSDIDTVLPQQAEYLARNTCTLSHTIPYYRDQSKFILH